MEYSCPSDAYKMFIPKTSIGKFLPRLNAINIANNLLKENNPNINKFVTKFEKSDSDWFTECWVNPNVGIGDHSMLPNNEAMLLISNKKSYHKLIIDYTKPANTLLEYEWEGVYTFKCEDDIRSVQNYYSNLSF